MTGLGSAGWVAAVGATTPTPTVTVVSPGSGSTLGGSSVTITGTNFTGATAVTFGTVPAQSFTVNSATQITATSPVATGTVDVTVTTPAGVSAIDAPVDWFTFVATPLPTVTAVSPSTGSAAGGTPVTITGTNFTAATQVRFGTAAASSLTVNSATSITATSPPEPLGTVDVSVTTGSGTSSPDPPSDQFTFVTGPVGTLVSMQGAGITTLAVSPQAPGDVLVVFAEVGATTPTVSTISGGGVTTWTKAVQFEGSGGTDEEVWYGPVTTTGASTVSFTWSSPITADTVEYGAQEFGAGLGASTAWTLDKTGTLDNTSSTTVSFPSLTPSGGTELYFGYAVPGTTASVGTTSGFTYALTASGNVAAFDPDVSGAASPTATEAPAGISSSIGVLLGASNGSPPPAPTVTGVSPSTGSTAGGEPVTVTGTDFTGATTVMFGTVPATFFPVSATQISATAPTEAAGAVDVTVTAPGGTSAVNAPADQFTFAAPPPPTVTGVAPSSGSAQGGTTVTVTGTNLSGTTSVSFGTVAAAAFVVNTDAQVTAASPAGTGTVDVTVTTGEGTSAISTPADQFTFTSSPPPPSFPTITAVHPSSGPMAGGTSVTITGTNFTGAVAVRFDTALAPTFTVNSATSITAVTPAGSPGVVDVIVVTLQGTSPTGLADRFTYQGPGYWMAGSDGSLFAFGGAPFEGSLPSLGVRVHDIVALVPTADSRGYWMIGSDGGVFAFGDAGFVGSLPGLGIHVRDVVGAVPTSDGKGYWMIGADGGVFAFGDAGFVGSLPGLGIHVRDVVGAVPTSDGKGYWMIGADGGVFSFGDAGFVGSLPGLGIHVPRRRRGSAHVRRQGLLDDRRRRRGLRLRRRRVPGIAPRPRHPSP